MESFKSKNSDPRRQRCFTGACREDLHSGIIQVVSVVDGFQAGDNFVFVRFVLGLAGGAKRSSQLRNQRVVLSLVVTFVLTAIATSQSTSTQNQTTGAATINEGL